MQIRPGGRPPEFRQRARLMVYVEAEELQRLHVVAAAIGAATTSRWARQILLEAAAAHDEAPAGSSRGGRNAARPRHRRAAGAGAA